MGGIYVYALIRNPNAADGDPGFWIVIGAAGVLGVGTVAQMAVQLTKSAEQVVTEGGSR